jgi:hypothetical protein
VNVGVQQRRESGSTARLNQANNLSSVIVGLNLQRLFADLSFQHYLYPWLIASTPQTLHAWFGGWYARAVQVSFNHAVTDFFVLGVLQNNYIVIIAWE